MTKEEIQEQIKIMDAYIPVYKIEEKLEMPATTLQKVLSGKRELPKKWQKVLETYFVKKPSIIHPPEKPETEPKEDKPKEQFSSFNDYRKKKMGLK